MGLRKQKQPETFWLSRHACLTMILSAAEVFPRECMGGICVRKDDHSRIVSTHPWQNAKRKYLEVVSGSSWEFSKIMKKDCPWRLYCDYHSHTYRAHEKLDELEPSGQDLRSLNVGDTEFIVRVHRSRKNEFWMKGCRGHVEAALGPFRFQIKAFRRIAALDKKKPLLYKTVRVRLGE
jgi:hypothetical protein